MEDLNNKFNHDFEVNESKYSVFFHLKYKKIFFYIFCLILVFFISSYFFLSAPSDFKSGSIVRVEDGMSLRSVSLLLKKQNIIKSRVVFESFVILFGGELNIKSTDYLFEDKLFVWSVAKRILKGEGATSPVTITIPEGFDVNQIADTCASKLNNFNKNKFLLNASKLEGYLFPDTYFFLTNSNEKDVLEIMNNNFKKKIASFSNIIYSSNKSEKEIIIMASIIEREAMGNEDRDFISGILWKRISIGMPLQVDAAPLTYKTKGLPDNPIANPGIKSIKAAIYPKNSVYLYYLHDDKGSIHYAKDFKEHVSNKIKYLNK